MEKIIPLEETWLEFLNNSHDSACSGLGSCESCKRKMYPLRQKYLKSWMRTFIEHEPEIRAGRVTIHKLMWVASDTAKEFKLGEFHKTKCETLHSVTNCACSTALLLRTMYGPQITDDDVRVSVDIIYPLYKK